MEARILIIDNDELMRELLTVCLQSQGCQVFSYAYAGITLAALEHLHPDLIILDFDFRDGSGTGWELLQLLKMEDTLAHIPVLITTTAYELSAEIRGYLLLRYITVIPKPFDLDLFLTLVQKTLTLAGQARLLFSSKLILPILVVDDTEDLLEAMTTVLQLEGFPVVTASNGLIALDRVSRADHCLILLDVAMPFMNGFEFLYAYNWQLRPHSPVIIVSGETNIREHVLPAFVVDVLPKPFAIMPLLRLVRKYARTV